MSTDSENVKRKQESSWIRYRRAVLNRDHFRAFELIPAILRFDPSNKDALAEQQRLAGKLRHLLAEEITAAIRTRDPKQAASVLRRRKRLPSEFRPRSPELEECWNLARPALIVDAKRESGKLIARAQPYRLQGDLESWKQVSELLKQVTTWCESVNIDPEKDLDGDSSAFKTLKEWVEAGEKATQVQEWAKGLRQRVEAAEELCNRARWKDVESLREFHAQLGESWMGIMALNTVIPPETNALYASGRSLLEETIAKLGRKHKLAVTSFATSAIAALVIAGMGVAAFYWAHRIVVNLRHLQKEGLVGRVDEPATEDAAAEGYFRFLGEHYPFILRLGVVAPELDKTTNWIGRVRIAQEEWGRQLDGLQPLAARSFSMFEGNAVTNLIARFAEATAVRTGVIETVFQFNSSLQTELGEDAILQRTQLNDRHEEWKKYCGKRDRFYEQEGVRLARELKGLLERGEIESNASQPGNALRSLRSIHQSIQAIADVIAQFKKVRGPRVPQVKIPDEPELQKRLDDLEKYRATIQSNLAGIDRAVNDMKSASSTEDYLKALRSYGAAGKALSLQETRTAELVGQTLLSERQLLGAILMPHDTAGFEFFCTNPAASMTPTNVTTEERRCFLILRDDDNLRNVYKYDWIPRNSPNAIGQIAYSIGPADEKSRVGPVVTYTGVFPYCSDARLGIMSRGAGTKSPESELFTRCGVGLLADSKVSRFTMSILQVMDAVDADTQASPLFKAYLQMKLYEFLMLRPREWGAHWLTTLRSDQALLLSSGADGLQSDDWMQPEKNQYRTGRLEKYYSQRRSRLPYLKQVQAMRELISSVYFQHRYAGYVDSQGDLQVRSEIENAGELWGLEQRTLKPASLFRAGSGQQQWIKTRTAQPMTPLLMMPSNKAAMLEKAARSMDLKLDDSTMRTWLPPFFQTN